MFDKWGRRWECLRGYDATRNGWWFDLRDVTDDPSGVVVLFAFRPDATGSLQITQCQERLSADIIAWFKAEAETAISPVA